MNRPSSSTRRRFRQMLVGFALGLVACLPAAPDSSNPAPARADGATTTVGPLDTDSQSVQRRAGKRLTLDERLQSAARCLAELDPEGAGAQLEGLSEELPSVRRLRAHQALMLGDCEGSLRRLGPADSPLPDLSALRLSALGCARAMAGAEVVSDETYHVWVRLQDPRDRVLLPLIVNVVRRVQDSLFSHLGVKLALPVRIELVGDLTSLAHLTSLPLEAAENTGTIAIARWGRVTMLSPRATREGYPWQDTLAHELTHLAVSRATRDEAPLWLQEGIAKREETRWRGPRPLDEDGSVDQRVRQQWLAGRPPAILRLGASMALEPTAEAASLAYAEVQSFLGFWLKHNGNAALTLLLRELRELGAARGESALVSVSGFGFRDWVRWWQKDLLAGGVANRPAEAGVAELPDGDEGKVIVQQLRLGQLMLGRRRFEAARRLLRSSEPDQKLLPEQRYGWALAELNLGRSVAAERALGATSHVGPRDGAAQALLGRLLRGRGQLAEATQAFEQGLAIAPTLERVACQGDAQVDHGVPARAGMLPTDEPWRSLCLDVRGTETP